MNSNICLHLHGNKIVHILNSSYDSSNDRLWNIFIKKDLQLDYIRAINTIKKKNTINKLVFQYRSHIRRGNHNEKKEKKKISDAEPSKVQSIVFQIYLFDGSLFFFLLIGKSHRPGRSCHISFDYYRRKFHLKEVIGIQLMEVKAINISADSEGRGRGFELQTYPAWDR